ncbi:hypothetical protein FSP39_005495 [Pinctada imbricata]|uniref:Methyltransferase domain-containing protein n=1 Tax=Pinctada imbricata TaxID=66713 RepID=A0AA88XG77_PINIB|nr:hypothetical protein FSP39_005495 [Pinctada imbricata]
MSYISKHQILCSQVRRMGNIVDGGWDICNDVQFRPKPPCLVYSFGISFDFSFDEAMEKVYGCEVYSFDPSMGTGNCEYSKRIHFYEVGLEDKEGYITGKEKGETWEVKRLKTIMKEFGHENRRIDVLKIDIEGHEKGSFVDILSSGALKNVAQLCVEFHSFYDLNVARKLYEIGFRTFWTHQNQAAPLYLDNETFTHGFEVSFVNVNLP